MKRVLVKTVNFEQNIEALLYDGFIEDKAERVIFHDDDGTVNEIRFNDNILNIRRFSKDLKTLINLSKEESYAKIKTSGGEIDIPITLKDISFGDDKISAHYYTGENIKMEICFIKEY